jgi:hypothetical protein
MVSSCVAAFDRQNDLEETIRWKGAPMLMDAVRAENKAFKIVPELRILPLFGVLVKCASVV